MTDTTHTTRIRVTTEARDVNKLEKDLAKAFEPKAVRNLVHALKDMGSAIREQTNLIRGLNEQIAKVGAGADGYRKLNRELGETSRKLREVGTAGGTVAGGGGGHGVSSSGNWRQWAFGRPTVAGAAMQMAGSIAGHPGIGGFAQALSAIPLGVGAVAAGGLIAASSTYSSYLRYEQARMAALPFLGARAPNMGMARRAGAAAETASELALYSVQAPSRQEWDAYATEKKRLENLVAAYDKGLSLDPEDYGSYTRVGRRETGLSQADVNEAMALGAIPAEERGGVIHGLAAMAGAAGRPAAAAEKARNLILARALAPYNVDTSAIEAIGGQYGLGPAEALTEAAAASKQYFGALGAGGYGALKGAELLFGVGTGQGAGIMGQFGRGYGAVADVATDADAFAQVLGDAVGDSVVGGLEGSQIGEYLGRMAGLMQHAAEMGSVINTTALGQDIYGLKAAGIAPVQAGRLGVEFAGGMMQAGHTGPRGAAGWALMRAAGWTGGGGPGEYARTIAALQNPGSRPGIMGRFLQQAMSPGLDAETQALVIQRTFQEVGTNIAMEDAKRLTQFGIQAGDPSKWDAKTIQEAGALAAGLYPGVRGEAGIEAERIGIGRGMVGTMQAFEGSVNNVASIFRDLLGPMTERLAAKFKAISEGRYEWGLGDLSDLLSNDDGPGPR